LATTHCERAADWLNQYECLRDSALNPVCPGEGWGLVTLLRSGLAAWLQALMAQSQRGEPAPAQRPQTGPVATAEREWVLSLTALVLGRTDQGEVRHG
jgi:hypothetical protein